MPLLFRGSRPLLVATGALESITIDVSVSNKPLHRSLVPWVVAIALAWTTLVAASLEWNLTNDRHSHRRAVRGRRSVQRSARCEVPRSGRARSVRWSGWNSWSTEARWSLGLLALGAAALFLRKRQREQALTEATLRQSEERFRALVEQAGDGFELVDADGRLVDVNDATCQQLGYSRDELLGLSIPDIDPDVTFEIFAGRFRAGCGPAGRHLRHPAPSQGRHGVSGGGDDLDDSCRGSPLRPVTRARHYRAQRIQAELQAWQAGARSSSSALCPASRARVGS